jgi:predicted membrane protein
MTISLILGLLGSGIILVIVGIIAFKLKRAKKDRNQNVILKKQKKSKSKIQKERLKNEKQKTEIKANINNASSSDLSNAYDDQLQNKPKSNRSRD